MESIFIERKRNNVVCLKCYPLLSTTVSCLSDKRRIISRISGSSLESTHFWTFSKLWTGRESLIVTSGNHMEQRPESKVGGAKPPIGVFPNIFAM